MNWKSTNWWMKFFKGGKKMRWHIFLLSNKLKMMTLSHYCQAASVWFSLKSQVQDQHALGVRSKTVHVWLVLPRERTMTKCPVTLWKSDFLLLPNIVVVTRGWGTWSAARCGSFCPAAEAFSWRHPKHWLTAWSRDDQASLSLLDPPDPAQLLEH